VTAQLSAREARLAFLAAQGLTGRRTAVAGLADLIPRVGVVQLDTISVLARSHELVAYTRLGAQPRAAVEAAYWGGDNFEYWAHAACILPLADWPLFAPRRAQYREMAPRSWEIAPEATFATVRARLAEGPVTARQLGGAKKGGEWWNRSDVKIAAEAMLRWGEVVCVERAGWQRVYDLAVRRVPPELLDDERTVADCHRELVARAGRHLGVATVEDLADYHRLGLRQAVAVVADSGLVPVTVAGWDRPAWADPATLEGTGRARHRTTLLSPFDPLVWERDRAKRVFGIHYRLEAYVPAPKRVLGYFAMPVLAGGRIVGFVDPGRAGTTVVAKRVTFLDATAVAAVATALAEAAGWVGADAVAVEQVEPAGAAEGLAFELAARGLLAG
jgi:uncharacterized protein